MMTESLWILVPLLVLPIVLLFRFVGCCDDPKVSDEVVTGQSTVPNYKDTILLEPSVIAYWRLVDVAAAAEAKDEKVRDGVSRNGLYKTAPQSNGDAPTATQAGSEAAGGDFDQGQTSLILSEPSTTKCRKFNGGYVLVDKPGLYTDDFTIEAWIDARWSLKQGYEHTLFRAGGYYRRPFESSLAHHGFRVFANATDGWQVSFFVSSPESDVKLTSSPAVTHNGRTHLVVTVAHIGPGLKKKVALFINGKLGGSGEANYYSAPQGAPLFIGIDNLAADPSVTPLLRCPVLSLIQEVVLYNKALSEQEIGKHFSINREF
jgi:hypothetical protein